MIVHSSIRIHMSNTCKYCGAIHKEGARFCPKTGKDLIDEPGVGPPTHPVSLLSKPPQCGKSRQPTIVIQKDENSFTQPIQAAMPPPLLVKGEKLKTEGKNSSGRGKCPLCGGYHSRKARFCPATGKTIFRKICPICGEEILLRKEDARFCPLCGGNMGAQCPYKECSTPLQDRPPFCKTCQLKILYCLYCKSANPLGVEQCLHCRTSMPQVPGEWLTFKGDNARTGFTREKLEFPLYLKWSFPDREKAQRITASPLVWNGTIYIGDHEGNLYALNQYNGAQKWSKPARSALLSTPVIDGGRLYLASLEGKVYALDGQTGKTLWVYPERKNEKLGDLQASLLVRNGRLFVATMEGTMLALDAVSGKMLWSFRGEKTTDDKHSTGLSPCEASGTLVYALPGGIVYALEAETGRELWRFPKEGTLEAQISCTPVAAEGLIFIGDRTGRIFSLKKETGEDTWHYSTQVEGGVNPSLSVGRGILFAGTWAEYFYALDQYAGGIRWRFKNEKITVWDSVTSPSLVLDQGVMLYGSSSGYLYALDMEGKEVWSHRLESEIHSSPVASDGFLYVGCTDGMLYAFYPHQA
jgi:outer membrane protein assembly factor BamB